MVYRPTALAVSSAFFERYFSLNFVLGGSATASGASTICAANVHTENITVRMFMLGLARHLLTGLSRVRPESPRDGFAQRFTRAPQKKARPFWGRAKIGLGGGCLAEDRIGPHHLVLLV